MTESQKRDQRPRPQDDVVELLLRQHDQIRTLFDRVERDRGQRRLESRHQLIRLLAAHETAEEMVVHPRARTSLPNGDVVVKARLEEEHEGKELLAAFEAVQPGEPEFEATYRKLKDAILSHADAEERTLFPALRKHNSPDQLRGMATLVRAAEAVAPTHPHPGVESATANVIAGPVAAVVDRVRDAIKAARGRAAETIEEQSDRLAERAERLADRVEERADALEDRTREQARKVQGQSTTTQRKDRDQTP